MNRAALRVVDPVLRLPGARRKSGKGIGRVKTGGERRVPLPPEVVWKHWGLVTRKHEAGKRGKTLKRRRVNRVRTLTSIGRFTSKHVPG